MFTCGKKLKSILLASGFNFYLCHFLELQTEKFYGGWPKLKIKMKKG